MDEPLETAELLAFVRIVDARSLSRAAAEMRVPRATLGRRLQRLEEQLAVRLLRRTTRSLVLTDAGERLYRHARIALDAVQQAELSVRREAESVRGDLRVAVPPFTNPEFFALVSRFAERFPEVRLQLHFSTQHVDLQRGGYDVAIRGTNELEPGLVARVLGRSPLIAVAAPRYLAERGTPKSLRDLKNHRCLLSFARGELAQTYWSDKRGRKVQVQGVAANDIRCLRHLAIEGLGIALQPKAMVQRELARGALVQVLEGVIEGDSCLAIVYPEREYIPAQVRAFVDSFVEWVRSAGDAALWPQSEDAQSVRAPVRKR